MEELQDSAKGILNLPSPIITEILSRLPIKTVDDCRCVCKSWNDLIVDPYFSQRYAVHAPTLLMLRVITKGIEKSVCIIEDKGSSIEKDYVTSKLISWQISYNRDFQIGNFCNGLVCLCMKESGNPVSVLDPNCGHCVLLPKDTSISSSSKIIAALGLCTRNNEYKVIRIYSTREAEINTLVTPTWRSIGKVPYSLDARFYGTYLNGAIHWIIDGHKEQLICSFDLNREEFLSVKPPPKFSNKKREYYWSSLGVFEGCLYICASDAVALNPPIETWVLKNYGVQESWIKMFEMKNPLVEWWNPYRHLQLIKVMKNGEILMFCGDRHLLCYNQKFQSYETLVLLRYDAIAVVPRWAPLKELVHKN